MFVAINNNRNHHTISSSSQSCSKNKEEEEIFDDEATAYTTYFTTAHIGKSGLLRCQRVSCRSTISSDRGENIVGIIYIYILQQQYG